MARGADQRCIPSNGSVQDLVATGGRQAPTAFNVGRSFAGKAVAGSYGSGPASRFGNLTAGLLSFKLDCETADFRENPESASCSHTVDQEIGMSMTGIKVLRPLRPCCARLPTALGTHRFLHTAGPTSGKDVT